MKRCCRGWWLLGCLLPGWASAWRTSTSTTISKGPFLHCRIPPPKQSFLVRGGEGNWGSLSTLITFSSQPTSTLTLFMRKNKGARKRDDDEPTKKTVVAWKAGMAWSLVCACSFWVSLIGLGTASVGAAPFDSVSSTLTTTTTNNSPPTARNLTPVGQHYWSIMEQGTVAEKIMANQALMDHAVGTVNTMYYDHSGGVRFQPRDFYQTWKQWLARTSSSASTSDPSSSSSPLATREGVVQGLKWLVAQLQDPYSQYLTREELLAELVQSSEGFLGVGARVQPPTSGPPDRARGAWVLARVPPGFQPPRLSSAPRPGTVLPAAPLWDARDVQHVPVVTAVLPDSPAERAGLAVGDRILAVGTDPFWGLSPEAVRHKLAHKYAADNYMGQAVLIVAQPVYSVLPPSGAGPMPSASASTWEEERGRGREVIVGYRPMRVRLPTMATSSSAPALSGPDASQTLAGGNTAVHYQLFTKQSSILDRALDTDRPIGYIRFTRFSKAATAGFFQAVETLEQAGAMAYIIDLRNNYGGVIQEAMLCAASLLRSPHDILTYTMNSRGGFTPHDVEEFVIDKRYPGYLMSREPRTVTVDQIRKERPGQVEADGSIAWSPPSSYASLHEQRLRRGINQHPVGRWVSMYNNNDNEADEVDKTWLTPQRQLELSAQKRLVILVNEGTASSAEVFASALRDNGRALALIGSQTFGKGLVQHTFPLPDGGGLRLTVAEYLTPALQHVTRVGGAQFDRVTGDWLGSGLLPDVRCENRQGIPSNVGADLCVTIALDQLQEEEHWSFYTWDPHHPWSASWRRK